MDDVGSEIGQKMRSAIKAKLTELGCYVDDELPDYVMVMVANKRTRAQMEDDLQLFLGDNTELFVNWLHQVLKKLQEVTVTAPLKSMEKEKSLTKEHKSKDKKEKGKKNDSLKKAKKKEKEKAHRKKEEKKNKKKSKHHEMIRPNIPPLLMNMEKESEPSITDVFAGQILKNHGINLDTQKEELKHVDKKPNIQELKRPILPIIDPASISSQVDPDSPVPVTVHEGQELPNTTSVSIVETPRDEQINEINEIEAKIQGLKQKLAEQLDSMSDDEDFLNIRTEAEELMNDFAEDVFQEISQQTPVDTPSLNTSKAVSPPPPIPKPPETTINPPKESPIEILPQIELKLPKRPVRERLGAREEPKTVTEVKEKVKEKGIQKRTDSPERFTPEREPEVRPQIKSAKSRLGELPEPQKRSSVSENTSDKTELSSKRLTSKVSVLESRPRASCASVVRVRPRPRGTAPAPALLLRAVADAHKSLLNIPPKVDPEAKKVKRALVRPMRRCVDAQKIVIQVPGGNSQTDTNDNISFGDMDSEDDKTTSDGDKDEYVPPTITKKIINNDYVPSSMEGRLDKRPDEGIVIDSFNIHNPTVGKDKNTQFIVTMDGYHPNAFLAKKLMTEGLLNDEDDANKTKETPTALESPIEEKPKESDTTEDRTEQKSSPKNNLSETVNESESPIKIKIEDEKPTEKRKSSDTLAPVKQDTPPIKKRKGSPIVFDVIKKEKEVERVRERTESASSDNHVTVTTTVNAHKYDALPPLSQPERKPVWCRAFPLCRYGAACVFQHPRCKFAAACTRRGCLYSHALNAPLQPLHAPVSPVLASHVVPAANFKTISPGVVPSFCKYHPNCTNPACHFYHPKPCRYGKGCNNKSECNFYHSDLPAGKWRYPA
ncbi:zinc finger CCCH domain-containing protein 14 [Achroia grisella]|uniref:zinc finger CCCH domain-containing protein 14 n=1 Tax=Achroia grisella TaxID=688607 RepID=UPI0027D2C060|nr:zinc finger CCCH domain-containing protein 14 [Achroia grisella]